MDENRLPSMAAIAMIAAMMLMAGCGNNDSENGSNSSEPDQSNLPDTYEVGEEIPYGPMTVTVTDVWKEEVQYDESYGETTSLESTSLESDAIPPDRHLYATVEVEASGDESAEFYPDEFSLRYANGETLPSVPVETGDHVTPTGTVSPGRPLSGEINWSISTGGEPFPDFEGAEISMTRYSDNGEMQTSYVPLPNDLRLEVEDSAF